MIANNARRLVSRQLELSDAGGVDVFEQQLGAAVGVDLVQLESLFFSAQSR
jgi:hypothetical protein